MSTRPERSKSSESGIALITAVLVVALLAAIGISFAFNMRLEEQAAANFMNSVKARYVAEAGIEKAIARLRNDADPGGGLSFAVTEHDQLGDAWNSVSGSIDLGGGVTGDYTVTVVDTARKIYLNDFYLTDANLGALLQNLVDLLIADTTETEFISGAPPGGDNDDGANIGSNRPTQAEGGYITPSQIMVVAGNTTDAAEYGTLRNYITSEGYFNPTRFGGRSAININTADQRVLQAVFESMDIGNPERDIIVLAILEYRSGREYNLDPDPLVLGEKWERTTTLIVPPAPGVIWEPANPFDGIDTIRGDGIDPFVGDPVGNNFGNDGLDNDGDGRIDENESDEGIDYDGDGVPPASPPPAYLEVEPFMFAGGARGEFAALMDYLDTTNPAGGTYGSGTARISSDSATASKNHANPGLSLVTMVTVGLDFESKFFAITSTGTITRAGETLAESKILRIVERER